MYASKLSKAMSIATAKRSGHKSCHGIHYHCECNCERWLPPVECWLPTAKCYLPTAGQRGVQLLMWLAELCQSVESPASASVFVIHISFDGFRNGVISLVYALTLSIFEKEY